MSSSQIPACQVPADLEPSARRTLLATQFVGVNLALFPNLTQSLAVDRSASETLIASLGLSAKTRGASRNLIPVTQVLVVPTQSAWLVGQAIPSVDVYPPTSQSRTPSLVVDENAKGIQTAGLTWCAATTSACPSRTRAYRAHVGGIRSATSTGRATPSAPASPATAPCLTQLLAATESPNPELRHLIPVSPPHVVQTLSVMSIDKETLCANASQVSAPCPTQSLVVKGSTRAGTMDLAG